MKTLNQSGSASIRYIPSYLSPIITTCLMKIMIKCTMFSTESKLKQLWIPSGFYHTTIRTQAQHTKHMRQIACYLRIIHLYNINTTLPQYLYRSTMCNRHPGFMRSTWNSAFRTSMQTYFYTSVILPICVRNVTFQHLCNEPTLCRYFHNKYGKLNQ